MIEGILPKINQLYDQCGLSFSEFHKEKESAQYDACTFKLDGKLIIYRTAKITPNKIGQFVTFWKRNANGITEPFDINDNFDFFVITTLKEELIGQFIFPKWMLHAKGVISGENSTGKRGIRVYPSWDLTVNKQSQKTQHWQLANFVNFDDDNPAMLKKLFK